MAYSAPESQNEVYVFDASTFSTIGGFSTPGDVSRLKTDSSGKYLFVAGLNNYYSSNAAIYVYATSREASVITSKTSITAPIDTAFSYQITASNSPTSFNATGLPAGLSINPATGVISGTVATLGESEVIISASNAIGVAFATLTISAGEGLTVSVNGGGMVTGGFPGTNYYLPGSAISIQATPDAGYVFSGWTGDITSGSNPLDFTLEAATVIQANFIPLAPAVTSAVQDSEYGAPFTYQILASGAGPITYGATGLPQGLSLDPGTGLITGTLNAAGNFTVGLSGSNSAGSGTGALWLDVTARLTVGAGSGGYVEPVGTHYLPLGSSVSLSATPVSGYAFKDWTGDFTSFANPLAFTLPSAAQVLANFVPWSTYDGPYSGLILSGTPAGINSGILSIRVNDAGLFIGNVIMDGVKYPILGGFPASNSTEISIFRKNLPPLIVTLNLDGSVSPPQVTGSVTAGPWTGDISAELSPVDSASNPSPRAGLYTVALYSSTESVAIPAGTGYATISISAAGVARVIGTLADGTPISASATISPDGTLPVYAALYRKQGVLIGTLEFESATSVGEIGGTLDWLRPPTSGTGEFAAGFSTLLQVAGSSYDRSAGLSATQGMITFAGGNLSASFSQAFSINGAGKIIIGHTNPHSVTVTLDQKTGVFSGTFIDARKTRRFHGVILQEQLAGAGVFVDALGSGAVSLTISP